MEISTWSYPMFITEQSMSMVFRSLFVFLSCCICHHTIQNSALIWLNLKCLSGSHIYIVAYRPVYKWWLCKQRPFLGNGSVNTFPLLAIRFSIMQQLDAAIESCVFYVVRARDVISKGQSQLLGSSAREAVKKKVSCKHAAVKRRLLCNSGRLL
jgi:hypothetical protein